MQWLVSMNLLLQYISDTFQKLMSLVLVKGWDVANKSSAIQQAISSTMYALVTSMELSEDEFALLAQTVHDRLFSTH